MKVLLVVLLVFTAGLALASDDFLYRSSLGSSDRSSSEFSDGSSKFVDVNGDDISLSFGSPEKNGAYDGFFDDFGEDFDDKLSGSGEEGVAVTGAGSDACNVTKDELSSGSGFTSSYALPDIANFRPVSNRSLLKVVDLDLSDVKFRQKSAGKKNKKGKRLMSLERLKEIEMKMEFKKVLLLIYLERYSAAKRLYRSIAKSNSSYSVCPVYRSSDGRELTAGDFASEKYDATEESWKDLAAKDLLQAMLDGDLGVSLGGGPGDSEGDEEVSLDTPEAETEGLGEFSGFPSFQKLCPKKGGVEEYREALPGFEERYDGGNYTEQHMMCWMVYLIMAEDSQKAEEVRGIMFKEYGNISVADTLGDEYNDMIAEKYSSLVMKDLDDLDTSMVSGVVKDLRGSKDGIVVENEGIVTELKDYETGTLDDLRDDFYMAGFVGEQLSDIDTIFGASGQVREKRAEGYVEQERAAQDAVSESGTYNELNDGILEKFRGIFSGD